MENGQEIEIGADVDVKAIMAEVRAEVERKKREGLYPPEVVDELDALGTTGAQVDQLTRAILGLRHGASFDTAVPTASRIPVAGPLAASFKRAVRSSVHWYVSAIVQQIEQFGANLIHVLNLTAERIREIEQGAQDRSAEQGRELAELRRSLAPALSEARGILDDLKSDVEASRARDRLPMLERAVRSLEDRIGSEPAGPSDRAGPGGPSLEADSALDYFDFENQFRGTEEDIRERQARYIEHFRDAPGPVVDLGCGRGEFLEVIRDAGIEAYGVDRHPHMVARCEEKGLDVRMADALEHLRSAENGSLGGIFSAQTIEHLPVHDVPRFFELAADALAPGGCLVVETLNPQSLVTFAGPFYADLGHLRPLHPLTLRFLAEKSGFKDVRVEYTSLPPDDHRPKEIDGTGDPRFDRALAKINANFSLIDRILFGPQDYAIVATR